MLSFGNLAGSGIYLSEIAPSLIGGGTIIIGSVIIAIGLYHSLLPMVC
jgi:hypothetical protein